MRVRFVSSFDSSERLKEVIETRLVDEDNYDSRVEIVIDDSYDFLVILNESPEDFIIRTPRERNIVFIQEPPTLFNCGGINLSAIASRIYAPAPEAYFNNNCFIYNPVCLVYFFEDRCQDIKRLDNFDKPKKLSIIVSSKVISMGHIERFGFVERLFASDLDFDFYGRGWIIPDKRYKGELEDKKAGLLDYEYSIAIENSSFRGYITEKFFDCILCNTVPIYHGAPDVSDIYPGGSFIPLNIHAPDAIERIREAIAQPNIIHKEAVKEAKEIYFKKQNLYSKTMEFIFT